MNKFELIKEMTIEQAAHYLCYLHDDCDKCPRMHHCGKGHNGWLDYLSRQATNTDRGAAGLPVSLEELQRRLCAGMIAQGTVESRNQEIGQGVD